MGHQGSVLKCLEMNLPRALDDGSREIAKTPQAKLCLTVEVIVVGQQEMQK